MDYKYIEQLLERYWACETTLQEEAILRAFFSQEEIPEALRKYQALFTYEQQKDEPLGEDFEARILQQIGEAPVAKTVTLKSRLVPLFRAAAIVAIVLTLGNAAQAPWEWGWDDPKDAYAKFHKEKVDSVNVLNTIQAENVTDSLETVKFLILSNFSKNTNTEGKGCSEISGSPLHFLYILSELLLQTEIQLEQRRQEYQQ